MTNLMRGFLVLVMAGECFAGGGKYGSLSLVFEANHGQTDCSVRYLARGQKYTVAVVDDGVQLRLRGTLPRTVRFQLTGSVGNPGRLEAAEKLAGVTNYFMGNDPRAWIQGLAQYGKVWQRDAYAGIDIAYYGNQGQLEYDFVVHPGGDPAQVRMHITGADQLRIDGAGDLILAMNGGDLRQKLPIAWQDHDGKRTAVRARYRLMGRDMVGLAVEDYDKTQPLVIDPVLTLVYSTYLGGSLADQGHAIAVDAAGNAWIAGSTTSLDFPVTGTPKLVNAGGMDAFVAKLDPTGTMLLFATYIGGSGSDQANGIAVDPAGNVYLTGSTDSTNFPTLAPLQMANAGGLDAFVMKLNSTGTPVYSTYVGGAADDSAAGIAVDANGVAYVAGYTSSINFPMSNPQQNASHGQKDSFILKLSVMGNALLYSTYLGGAGNDQANGIAIDPAGNAYIAGSTESANFPTSAAFQSQLGGSSDGFVAKFTAIGIVAYSTYLGGRAQDVANGIAVDASGAAFVTGSTLSTDFPVLNAVQSTWSDARSGFFVLRPDAFLTKLNPAGSALVYSTYLGGATTFSFMAVSAHPGGDDIAYGVAVDAVGNAYIAGSTADAGSLSGIPGPLFPLQDPIQGYAGPAPDALGPWYHPDGFVASFSPIGALRYATDLGGSLDDVATAIAVNADGAYVTGYSSSADFPLQTPLQATNPSACAHPQGCVTSNAFISKVAFNAAGVRVFLASAIPSNTGVSAAVPVHTNGAGCNSDDFTVTANASGTLGTPVIFQPGLTCTVTVQTSAAVAGVRYTFSNWADGLINNPRTIPAPEHSTAYTINVAPQYQLVTGVTPAGAGTIQVTPASADGFYAAGTNLMVAGVPSPGYVFSHFSGALIGLANSQTVIMSGPRSLTAVFVPSGPPTVAIDTPLTGAIVSGQVTVSGWAIDNINAIGTAISSVQVKVDGAVVGTATYGVARPDVCNAYPGRVNCPNVGYSFTLNSTPLAAGVHTITVSATDSDGAPDAGSASVNVTIGSLLAGTKVGAVRNGTMFLEDSNGNGLFDQGSDRFIANFTAPGGFVAGDVAVTGDWTGDGHAKAGIYRPSTGSWWLDANNDGVFNAGDLQYQFGRMPGDIPVVGNWNGVQGVSTKKDCIGIYRSQGSIWLLDLNCNGVFEGTPTDSFFPFGGLPGDVPVVGNWTGGTTRVGVVRKYAPGGVPQGEPFFWVYDNANANAGNNPVDHPAAAGAYAFGGLPGDLFVTGDWNNSGTAKAGVFRSGVAGAQQFQWVLDANGLHTPDVVFNLFGVQGDRPITGKW